MVYLSHEGDETEQTKNIQKNDQISFEIGDRKFNGKARVLDDSTEEAWRAKLALYEKYYEKASREIIQDWFSLSKLG